MKKIDALRERIKKAEAAMSAALERKYPVGTTLRFYIMYGQVTPSKGDVISHPGGRCAYVRVRLHSRTRSARDIPAANIL